MKEVNPRGGANKARLLKHYNSGLVNESMEKEEVDTVK
jgi:hypothetical protein